MDSPSAHSSSASLASALLAATIDDELNAPRNLGCPRRDASMLFDEMPDDCLEAILDHVPMQQLLAGYRAISRKWNNIIESLCRRKASLLLYDILSYHNELPRFGQRFFRDIDLNNIVGISMRSIKWDTSFRDFFLHLFVRPKFVAIYFICYNSYDEHFMIELLKPWSSSLVTLSMSIPSTSRFVFPCSALFNFLNKECAGLKQLNIYAKGFNKCPFSELAPTLARLENFSTNTAITSCTLIGPECKRVSYSYSMSSADIRQWITATPTHLASLTHLRIEIKEADSLTLLLDHCRSLKVLVLSVHFRSILNFSNIIQLVFTPMALLQKLIELRLTCYSPTKFHEIVAPPEQLTPLNSVRKLRLNIVSLKLPGFFFHILASYFPNLERLIIGSFETDIDSDQYATLFPKLRTKILFCQYRDLLM